MQEEANLIFTFPQTVLFGCNQGQSAQDNTTSPADRGSCSSSRREVLLSAMTTHSSSSAMFLLLLAPAAKPLKHCLIVRLMNTQAHCLVLSCLVSLSLWRKCQVQRCMLPPQVAPETTKSKNFSRSLLTTVFLSQFPVPRVLLLTDYRM